MRRWTLGGALLALGAIVAACGAPDPASPVEVPQPVLERFDPEVREAIEAAREALAAASARGAATADDWGELGMLFQAHDLRDAAAACYDRAATLDPQAFAWPYYLAWLHRAGARPDPALAAVERALNLRPDDLPALVLAGELLIEAGREEPARRRLERALELDADCAPALVALGRLDLQRRDFAGAAARLERALAIAPTADSVHYPLAMAYRGLGETDRAAEHLARRGEVKVRVPDPLLERMRAKGTGARVHHERGKQAAAAGRYAEAVAEFRLAVAANPEDVALRKYLALAADLHGDRATAREQLDEALRLDPRDSESNLHLGVLLAREGEDAGALARLAVAVDADPNLVLARLNLAAALQRVGRHAEALPHYERVIELDPTDAQARLGRATAAIASGRDAQARRGLEQDLAVLPGQPAFAHALARLLACSGDESVRDGARALALVQQLAERLRSTDVAETIAMALAENGRFDEAARWQRGAIEAARAAGNEALAQRMGAALGRYERRLPCRRPWREDDPIWRPPPTAVVPGG